MFRIPACGSASWTDAYDRGARIAQPRGAGIRMGGIRILMEGGMRHGVQQDGVLCVCGMPMLRWGRTGITDCTKTSSNRTAPGCRLADIADTYMCCSGDGHREGGPDSWGSCTAHRRRRAARQQHRPIAHCAHPMHERLDGVGCGQILEIRADLRARVVSAAFNLEWQSRGTTALQGHGVVFPHSRSSNISTELVQRLCARNGAGPHRESLHHFQFSVPEQRRGFPSASPASRVQCA
ncbi:hypothetical protein B0H17DRAFT_695348 [Mycena rosella]|uniref:Uncharacterized protein n=1 Tax=Mycena rosella TaxID=1033263 RepID=A0AAD7M7M3_MYCRO|nr:hypothetical protein B0H17DRAFT_695348 [Mycena rosella]